MKAYDACPKCRSIDHTKEWVQGETKRPYYFCVCQECGNIYYQTYQGQETNDTNPKVPIKSTEIKTELIDPVPYKPERTGPEIAPPKHNTFEVSIQSFGLLPPSKRGKDTTSQARL